MLERQKVPEGYVQETVTSTIQERLNTISQQILSRTNLEKIIRQIDLLKEEFIATPQGGTMDRMLSTFSQKLTGLLNLEAIVSHLNFFDSKHTLTTKDPLPVGDEEILSYMGKNIEIKVIGKDAFTIAYTGRNPTAAMNITNMLASLFIDQNLKSREEQAQETSRFMEGELKQAEVELEKRERYLKEFKTKNMGALPQQLEVNLKTLDRLHSDSKSISDSLKNGNELLEDIESGSPYIRRQVIEGKTTEVKSEVKSNSLIAKREALIDELSKLQAEYNDNYPDIVVLQKQIRDLELALKAGLTSLEPTGHSENLPLQKLQPRVQVIKSEIEALRAKQKETIAQIKEYERRVEATFANEQMLSSLTRDYDMARGSYSKLLEKTLNAKSSETLERLWKAERFKVLDPANLPGTPYKPDRMKIILIGTVCGVGLGAGLVLLREYRHSSFRKPEDLDGIVDVPTLVTIPRHRRDRISVPQLRALHEPASIMTEQYRILFAKINQLTKGEEHPIIAISSPIQGEGKTVTALNLAIVAARDFGKKTLLIEGDFKNPRLSRSINAKLHVGLSDILLDKSDLHSTLLVSGHGKLSVLPAGTSIQNSLTLLNSPRLKELLGTLKEIYDIILIDSPPILPLPDMHIFEELVDSIVLVVRAESTPKDALVMALDSLATDKLLGIILNDVKQPLGRYYRYDHKQA